MPKLPQVSGEDMERSIGLAEQVNDVLSRYIAVHNALFGFSIRKVIPVPRLFKPLDFARYRSDLTDMVAELNELNKVIDQLYDNVSSSSPIGLFLTGLREYSNALADTIASLRTLCHNLYLKSQRSSEFTWAQHHRAVEEYKALVECYRAEGARLNEMFGSLQS